MGGGLGLGPEVVVVRAKDPSRRVGRVSLVGGALLGTRTRALTKGPFVWSGGTLDRPGGGGGD